MIPSPSPFLIGRDRYERTMEGWIDDAPGDALCHTVRIADNDFGVECRIVAALPPSYEVREARARIVSGAIDPMLPEAFGQLAGARMVGGFTRRLAEACGARPGSFLLVDAGIEAARLARQATKMPRSAIAGVTPGDARTCWDLDTTGWADLPNSCFTYSDDGRALLDIPTVQTAMDPELYSPRPGARKIFVRRKLARLVLTGNRLHLFHSMHDNVHGFDIHYEIDVPSRAIVAADSTTSRLPYAGICDAPQGRIAGMIGQRVDPEARKRIRQTLGGQAGCAQLYDLTADLLKLVSLGGDS